LLEFTLFSFFIPQIAARINPEKPRAHYDGLGERTKVQRTDRGCWLKPELKSRGINLQRLDRDIPTLSSRPEQIIAEAMIRRAEGPCVAFRIGWMSSLYTR